MAGRFTVTIEVGDAIAPPDSPTRLRLNSSVLWVLLTTGRKGKRREWWCSGARSRRKTVAAIEGAETAEEVRVGLQLIGSERWALPEGDI